MKKSKKMVLKWPKMALKWVRNVSEKYKRYHETVKIGSKFVHEYECLKMSQISAK